MSDQSLPAEAGLTRRALLGAGLAAPAAAFLSGCQHAGQPPAAGFRFLREADVALLRALMPVVLDGALSAEAHTRARVMDATLRTLDGMLYRVGPSAQRELVELFDLLQFGPARWLATGMRPDWPQASAADIERLLQRWHDSSISLFTAGYRALTRLISSAYFMQPESFAASGYPGPPQPAFTVLNS